MFNLHLGINLGAKISRVRLTVHLYDDMAISIHI